MIHHILNARESPGNVALADVVDPQPEVERCPEPKMPLIPRKRMRKGYREPPKTVKRQRFEEAEEAPEVPAPRITRAAIKAEEEAQDTMEVLSALAGIAPSTPSAQCY